MQIVKIKKILIRLKKHIALLLLGIFFFSILIQSVHIVWHHSLIQKCEHYICHKKTPNKYLFTKQENVSEKEETCLICEYNFSINDSPKVFFLSTVIPAIASIFHEIYKQQQYIQVFSDKTPRAPPVLIS